MKEMRNMVRESSEHTRLMVENFDKHRLTTAINSFDEHRLTPALRDFDENQLKPVIKQMDLITKTFVYGLVGMMIVFIGQKGINLIWDGFFKKNTPAISEQNRHPLTMRKRS